MSTPENKISKRRVLVIGAREFKDFLRAYDLVLQFPKDVITYQNEFSGRRNHIVYGRSDQRTAAVWQTKTQITVYFSEE